MKKTLVLIFILLSSILKMPAQPWMWEPLNTGLQNATVGVDKISMVDSNVVWCISSYYAPAHEYARSTDGGVTWKTGIITTSTLHSNIGIAAIDSSTAYVVMYGNNSNNAIYKTVDGGSTWLPSGAGTVFTQTASYPDAIYFWDAANGIVFGDPVNNVNEIYTTSDSGNTWVQVPSANLPANSSGTVYNNSPMVVLDSMVWALTSDGKILRSADRGQHWTISSTGAVGNFFFSIAFLDDKMSGLAVYGAGNSYKTVDGGITWTINTSTGNGPFNNIVSVPGSNYFVCNGGVSTLKSSYSVDTGSTWITIDSGGTYFGMAFKDINNGFAGGTPANGFGGIYKWAPKPVVGINQLSKENKMQVYPNPVHEQLLIKGCNAFDVVNIINITGQILTTHQINYAAAIDVSFLPSGFYFLKTENSVRKFVKE